MIEEKNQKNTCKNGQIRFDHCPRRYKPGYILIGSKVGVQLTRRRIEKKEKDLNWHSDAIFATSIVMEMNGGKRERERGKRLRNDL